MQSLPHPSGFTEEHPRVSLASGGHAFELPGYGLEGVAEPEVLSVEAAGQDSGVVLVHIKESLSCSNTLYAESPTSRCIVRNRKRP